MARPKMAPAVQPKRPQLEDITAKIAAEEAAAKEAEAAKDKPVKTTAEKVQAPAKPKRKPSINFDVEDLMEKKTLSDIAGMLTIERGRNISMTHIIRWAVNRAMTDIDPDMDKHELWVEDPDVKEFLDDQVTKKRD